jgi:hypothetical protein
MKLTEVLMLSDMWVTNCGTSLQPLTSKSTGTGIVPQQQMASQGIS